MEKQNAHHSSYLRPWSFSLSGPQSRPVPGILAAPRVFWWEPGGSRWWSGRWRRRAPRPPPRNACAPLLGSPSGPRSGCSIRRCGEGSTNDRGGRNLFFSYYFIDKWNKINERLHALFTMPLIPFTFCARPSLFIWGDFAIEGLLTTKISVKG